MEKFVLMDIFFYENSNCKHMNNGGKLKGKRQKMVECRRVVK